MPSQPSAHLYRSAMLRSGALYLCQAENHNRTDFNPGVIAFCSTTRSCCFKPPRHRLWRYVTPLASSSVDCVLKAHYRWTPTASRVSSVGVLQDISQSDKLLATAVPHAKAPSAAVAALPHMTDPLLGWMPLVEDSCLVTESWCSAEECGCGHSLIYFVVCSLCARLLWPWSRSRSTKSPRWDCNPAANQLLVAAGHLDSVVASAWEALWRVDRTDRKIACFKPPSQIL